MRSMDSTSSTSPLARIFQQAQQLWPVGGGAASVLQVHAGDDLVMVAGELLERGAGRPASCSSVEALRYARMNMMSACIS